MSHACARLTRLYELTTVIPSARATSSVIVGILVVVHIPRSGLVGVLFLEPLPGVPVLAVSFVLLGQRPGFRDRAVGLGEAGLGLFAVFPDALAGVELFPLAAVLSIAQCFTMRRKKVLGEAALPGTCSETPRNRSSPFAMNLATASWNTSSASSGEPLMKAP